jgi:hypothetical protein
MPQVGRPETHHTSAFTNCDCGQAIRRGLDSDGGLKSVRDVCLDLGAFVQFVIIISVDELFGPGNDSDLACFSPCRRSRSTREIQKENSVSRSGEGRESLTIRRLAQANSA